MLVTSSIQVTRRAINLHMFCIAHYNEKHKYFFSIFLPRNRPKLIEQPHPSISKKILKDEKLVDDFAFKNKNEIHEEATDLKNKNT